MEALARVRARDRGRARAPGAQARALRAAVGDRRRAVRARDEHLLAARHGDRAGREQSRARRRHALLQPGAGDGAARGRRRRASSRAGARAGRRDRRGDGQARDPRERRAGLPRQPLQPPVRPGGAAAAAGADRRRRDDRPDLPHAGRLSDGPVRADGPGRRRRRLRDLQELLRRRASASRAGARRRSPRATSLQACTGARAGAATTTTPSRLPARAPARRTARRPPSRRRAAPRARIVSS